MLEHFTDLIGDMQFVRVKPDALSHEEGEVVHTLLRLNLKAVQQLLCHQLQHLIEPLVEGSFVVIAFQRNAREVDGGEGQVAAGIGDLAGRVIHIAHHAGTAAHGGHFGLRTAGHIVLQVIGRIQEHEVREETLCTDLAAHAEQIIVGIAGIIVDAFLDLEDVDRENAGLAVSESGIQCQKHIAHRHAAFRRHIGAIVDRGEGGLSAGTGMHGVQVVHEALHRLEGLAVRADGRALSCALEQMPHGVRSDAHAFGQGNRQLFIETGTVFQLGQLALCALDLGEDLLDIVLKLFRVAFVFNDFCQDSQEILMEALANTLGHGIVEVRDRLAAVLVVLVGLDGDRCQGCIACDRLGLAQIAVACGKTVVEQAQDIDLRAGRRHVIEVKVVNVDIAFAECLGMLRTEEIHFIVGFCSGRADLQHAAHRGIAVDVGVVALQVAVDGVFLGDLVDGLHERGVRITGGGAVRAVENVGLGSIVEAVLHQLMFNCVLNGLNVRRLGGKKCLQFVLDCVCNTRRVLSITFAYRFHRTKDCRGNLRLVVKHTAPVALDDAAYHRNQPPVILFI